MNYKKVIIILEKSGCALVSRNNNKDIKQQINKLIKSKILYKK